MPVEPTMDSMIGTQPTIQSGIDTNVNKDFGRLDDAQQENVQVIEEKMTWGTISLESDDLRNRAWRAVMDRYWAVQPQHDEAVDLFDKYGTTTPECGLRNYGRAASAPCGSALTWDAAAMP